MAFWRMSVDLTFPVGGGGGTNTWHFRTVDALFNPAQVATFTDIIRDWYVAVSNVVPVTYVASWDGNVSEVGTATPQLGPTATGWAEPGTAPGSYTGAPSMACTTWRSGLATRRGRGRTFHGPLAASAIEGDGTLTAGAINGLRASAAALILASATAIIDGSVVVWSELDQQGRDIVAAGVTDQIAVLRSRRG